MIEANTLPTIFILLMSLAILAYAILDGYDLGVGILLPGDVESQRNPTLIVHCSTKQHPLKHPFFLPPSFQFLFTVDRNLRQILEGDSLLLTAPGFPEGF